MLYKIKFKVDNGASYIDDVALVEANNSKEANRKLEQLINSIDYETRIYRIYRTDIFNGDVFTGKFGCK